MCNNISMKDMGARIKELREGKGVSQKQLADKVGVKQHTISQYENNIRRPSYEALLLIAKIFDVTAGQLLGSEDL